MGKRVRKSVANDPQPESVGMLSASRSQIGRDCSSPLSVLAEPIQTRSSQSAPLLLPRDRIVPWIHTRGNHVHSFDPGARLAAQQSAKEIVARDDRIDHADGPGKPPGPPAALLTATIVRIAKEDGIVKIVNKMACASAQSTQLPSWKELALQNYRIEFCGSAQLKRSKERCLVESFARKGPARVIEGGSKGPDTVATTNVIGRFNQGK